MSDFVHLHLHTEYSLLDGATRLKEVFKVAKAKGMKAVAITDHGNMFGTLTFAEEAKKLGMQAIIGCEMYACDDYKNKAGRDETDHLILLCKNKKGYKNLVKLDSIAYVDGFYYKPRIDYNLLKEHSEGLVCLSACLAGRVAKRLLRNDYEGAKKFALSMRDIFGDDFYLEIQDHGLEEQKYINPMLIRLSKETGIKLVATNDVHYAERSDAEIQDVVMCISMKKTMDDPNRMKMTTDQMYMKSPEEMAATFPNLPEALATTLEIAAKCAEEEVFDLNAKCEPIRDNSLIPGYIPDNGQSAYEFLRDLAEAGLKKRYPVITEEIRKRFDYELNTIHTMGYIEYYLIVWDFINYAKSVGIPVGAGRGSGVSSIIAYSVGITDVDPLKYSLVFERFLNIERVSMPDFDIDFSDERRGEVVEYVRRKYGSDRVAQIVTFGTLKSKAAIKDVGRVFSIPYADVDRITKLMDGKSTIEESLGLKPNKDGVNVGVKELRQIYDEDPNLKKIIDIAIKVEGLPRNTSMHAAGVVICAKPIADNVPLQRNGDDFTTQFNMKQVEQLGMLKMDFLGLITLTDIKKAVDYVKETTGRVLDFHELGYEDPGTYDLIGSGDTDAVFQLESPGMKRFMRDLRPTTFEDIIAGISLYRPGPMDSIPDYIKYKHNPQSIKYKHPLMEPILSNSYGVMIYQEQVMEVCRSLGGFSFGQADIVRRAMGKKNVEEMDRQKKIFVHGGVDDKGRTIDGAIVRGVPEAVAIDIFDEMAGFAKYAFNKSHAAAYAVLAYQTAFLKKYYPNQFLAAILNNRITKIEEITKYLMYLRSRNIPVYPPDINKSIGDFKCEGDGIRFGLAAIKNVGENTINAMVEERKNNGDFKSFEDFAMRCASLGTNKRLVENLIYAGAFDSFGHTRSQYIAVYEEVLDRAAAINKQKNSSQLSLFGDIIKEDNTLSVEYPAMNEYPSQVKLSKEKAVLGVYVTGHPLSDFMDAFSKTGFNTSLLEYYEQDEDGNKTYTEIRDGQYVTVGGIVTSAERKTTKRGDHMAVLKVEDVYGQIDCVFFPKNYEANKSLMNEEEIVKISGRLQIKENDVQIVADKIEQLELKTKDKKPAEQEYLGLIIPEDKEKYMEDIFDIIESYEGDIGVVVHKGGKNYTVKNKVRRCEGLMTELKGILSEKEIVFFRKKS